MGIRDMIIGKSPLGWCARRSPSAFLFAAALAGFALLLAAQAVGVLFCTLTGPNGDKEVGFGWAPNWAFAYAILTPLFGYFVLSAANAYSRVGERLRQAGMLVGEDLKATRHAETVYRFRFEQKLAWLSPLALILFAVAIGESITEWWYFSGAPLLQGELPAGLEYDWSVCHISGTLAQQRLNAAFSLAAYGFQATIICLLLGLMLLVFAFSEVLRSFEDFDEPLIIVPNLRTDDRRRGFQVFEEPVSVTLYAVVVAMVLFYCVRLQNVYLASESPRLSTFVGGDIALGIRAGGMVDVLGALLDTGPLDFSSVFAIVGGALFLMLGVGVVVFALRSSAKRGQARLRDFLESPDGPRSFQELEQREALDRLTNMKLWPLEYPGQNQLLVGVVFAIAALVYFRIGLVFVGIAIAIAGRQVYRGMRAVENSPPVDE